MDIFQIAEHIRSNEAAIAFLRQRGILRSLEHPPLCPVEYQWRQLHGKKTVEAFNNILQQISHFYLFFSRLFFSRAIVAIDIQLDIMVDVQEIGGYHVDVEKQ